MPNTVLSRKPSKAGDPPAPAGLPPRWPYAIAAVGVVLDQITKQWFDANYALGESREVIPGFFHFTHARNTGAAFSLFEGHPSWLLLFSLLIFGLMALFRDHLFRRLPLEQVAYGFLVGGVLGNLIDRMKYGYVIDFVDWFIGDHHWPVFNLADVWICTGVGLYLLSQWRNPEPKSKPAAAEPEEA